MKNLMRWFIEWMIIVCLWIPMSGFAQETIRLGMNEFPPYISKDLPGYGFLPQIISESFALAGIKVEYVFVPWKRAIVTAEKGGLDGTLAWFRTPEREQVFYISAPLVDDSQSFFHLKEFPFEWKTIENLKGITIGATLGYDYGEVFAAAEKTKQIKVNRVSTDLQNFKKLFHKHIMVFPMNTFAGYAILQKKFPPEVVELVTHHPLPLRSQPLHLLLSKKHARNELLIQVFNQRLEILRKSGKYDQLLEKTLTTKKQTGDRFQSDSSAERERGW